MAAELITMGLDGFLVEMRGLRDRLIDGLKSLPMVTEFAERADRIANTVQFAIAGLDGATVQTGLARQGIAVSTGSACHNRWEQPSRVLMAMGVEPEKARGAVRVSIVKNNNTRDIDTLLLALQKLHTGLPGDSVTGWG